MRRPPLLSASRLPSAAALAGAVLLSACSGQSPVAPTMRAPLAASGLAASGSASTSSRAPASYGGPEYANVSTQNAMLGGVYAVNGAALVRQPNGLAARVTMPTPEPGTYNYPPGKVAGHPEVFTLWIFVFNNPELCSLPCDGNDLGNTPAQGGVYNGSGHFASGGELTLAGRVGVGEAPFAGVPLASPETATVHLAVAPHGAIDPSALPNEFRIPAGGPAMWWVAIFEGQ